MSTAAVLVTHNSARWIAETFLSVLHQGNAVDRIVIVDDHSEDNTLNIIREHAQGVSVEIVQSASQSKDVHTRIASNFVQGVEQAQAEFVFLGDHDDLWHAHRVSSQLKALIDHPHAALLASDGRIVNESAGATGKTLRDVFPVPVGFANWRTSQQFGYVVRHSVATGGACAIRPAAFHDLKVPAGWLHDRWWSLWATAHNVLVVDPTIVIDYRVSDAQQVGLDAAFQDEGAPAWLMHHAGQLMRSTRRAIDLVPLFIESR
ncbi:MAG: glycosyltransferase [Actinomycetota bacterium]|nr:glycosyltransferase [Actinomycetota bacterium]